MNSGPTCRNHSFGFSFAETNWVSVSTETRFEFRSTETLTETHILGNFSLFENFRNLFLELWIQFYSKITEKYRKVFGHLLLFNVQDDNMTSDMKIRQNMGFGQGFGSGFGFGETFEFRFRFRPKPKKWFRWITNISKHFWNNNVALSSSTFCITSKEKKKNFLYGETGIQQLYLQLTWAFTPPKLAVEVKAQELIMRKLPY